MTIETNADVVASSVTSEGIHTTGSGYTTFTFTAPSDIAITSVVFMNGNTKVTASNHSETGSTYWVSPVFEGVTVSNATNDVTFTGGSFKGTYKSITFTDEDPSILFLGAGNTLYYPESGAKIGAQRAYFQLDGLTAGESTSQVRAFNLRFVEDPLTEGSNFGSEDTGIVSLSKESGNKGNNPEFLNSLDYYSLDGLKLDKAPTRKGLYIHNGRKVVVK